ncbi:MAG: Gx transporter family protein [Spirochaetales bacterium]|jgi:uncharacterized membrane protein|nr:Gx transporter family protein [Spirochaetales bacterium]
MPRRTDGGQRQLAFFGAFCLFLSGLELLVPKPLPFLRMGLANMPVLLSLRLYSPRFTLALCALKIAGQAVINGTLFSYIFLFSSAGSLASAALMLACSRLFGEKMSLAGIGVLGSLASNLAQILFARYFLLGEGAWLIAPPFLALGTAAGFFLGLFAELMYRKSAWIARLRAADTAQACPLVNGAPQAAGSASAGFYALCGALSIFPFLFTGSLAGKLGLTALYIVLAAGSGRRIRALPNIVLVLTVTAAHCVTPFGKIIFTLGSFPVTEGALRTGLFRSATLIGLVYLSRLTVRPGLRFPGKAGRVFSAMLSDFERITGCGVKLERKNFRAGLDRLLEAVYRSGGTAGTGKVTPEAAPPPGFARRAVWLGFAALHWAVFALA